MRYIATWEESSDEKKLELNAADWQIELLRKNPSYTSWGCFEDYMSDKNEGWQSATVHETWKDFGPWGLDEYNEIVNFYFEVTRKGHDCLVCDGSGLNVKTKQLSDDWYDFGQTGREWNSKLTEVEVLALAKNGRLRGFVKAYFDDETNQWMTWNEGNLVTLNEAPVMPSADEVNTAYRKGMGHDAINKWICVKARAQNLGVYGSCPHCSDGTVYDAPVAHVSLQLWVLHPRKGCSRGVYIKTIKESEVPDVLMYLKQAAQRNADRFAKL